MTTQLDLWLWNQWKFVGEKKCDAVVVDRFAIRQILAVSDRGHWVVDLLEQHYY